MAQTASHLVDHVFPHVPVRQWVLSLPIPLRLLLAAQPKLVTPELQVVHRAITRFLLDQAGLKADEPVQTSAAGQAVLRLKTPWRDGTTHLVRSPLELMQRLAALVPRPRLHLIRLVPA